MQKQKHLRWQEVVNMLINGGLGDPRAIPAIEKVSPGFVPKVADGIEIAPSDCIQPKN